MQGLNNFIDYIINKKDFAEKTTIQNFIKDINNLKLFFCNFDYTQITNFERKEKILNIPFDKIWIENPNIKLNNGFMLYASRGWNNRRKPRTANCLFCNGKTRRKTKNNLLWLIFCQQ